MECIEQKGIKWIKRYTREQSTNALSTVIKCFLDDIQGTYTKKKKRVKSVAILY